MIFNEPSVITPRRSARISPPRMSDEPGRSYDISPEGKLTPGHKLAHYEILEPIGKGAMGAVYRAGDGKLGRDVAIKVFPDEFARTWRG